MNAWSTPCGQRGIGHLTTARRKRKSTLHWATNRSNSPCCSMTSGIRSEARPASGRGIRCEQREAHSCSEIVGGIGSCKFLLWVGDLTWFSSSHSLSHTTHVHLNDMMKTKLAAGLNKSGYVLWYAMVCLTSSGRSSTRAARCIR